MGVKDCFYECIDKIVLPYVGKPAAIFFQGLTPTQLRLLSQHPFAAEGLGGLLNDSGHLDPVALSKFKKNAFRQLILADGPLLFPYELLVDLKGSISEQYEDTVLVVRNNLFVDTGLCPSPFAPGELETAARQIEGGEGSSLTTRYYARVERFNDEYLVRPISVKDEVEISACDLFAPSAKVPQPTQLSNSIRMSVPGPEFVKYRIQLCNDKAEPATYVVDPEALRDPSSIDAKVLLLTVCVAHACGLAHALEADRSVSSKKTVDPNRLLPILRRYWGANAEFRELKFYRNPKINAEMRSVSQGEIASFVVEQAEAAMRGSDSFSDVFVTAPTGAGKSILFQLPALYLAQRMKVLTLVVEPLKALMHGQVQSLRKRGVKDVVAINSDLTFEERQEAYSEIRDGVYSVIYLSPELLLESSIDSILNGRALGLVVVDEVHTVTSWGKDFRPDYWYLGPYLTKLRKNGQSFPIFCLTATAVYGGKDDVVDGTIRDLELCNCKLYLGNPRRDDIGFSICAQDKDQFPGPIDEVKRTLASAWIAGAVQRNDHAIVYCPFKSQVDSIIEEQDFGTNVMGYHGGKDKDYKAIVAHAFGTGDCRVLVSTKAFGMGVDIDDINAVYHYAPTGNLSDYVQEIGRAARKKGLTAVATVDFFGQDTRYARQLYALSSFYQWQLKEILGKLYQIYISKPAKQRHQNMLVSPETFSYLFANEADRTRRTNRVKSALMMVSRDLEDRFNFPVLIVRPKPSYTVQYVCVDERYKDQVLAKYGKYLTYMSAGHSRTIKRNAIESPTRISDMGDIYKLEIASMWEHEYPEYTFNDFKRRLFAGEICSPTGSPVMANRLVLEINFKQDFEKISAMFETYAAAIFETLRKLNLGGDFKQQDFDHLLCSELKVEKLPFDSRLLLDALEKPVDKSRRETTNRTFKCVVRRIRSKNSIGFGKPVYNVVGSVLSSSMAHMPETLARLKPIDGSLRCRRFLDSQTLDARFAMAEILQALDLADYEARGGDNPEIFVRVNDPGKLKELANDVHYANKVLRDLDARHEYSAKVLRGFFQTKLSDTERWDLIEDYFLGNDERVAAVLGIDGVSFEAGRNAGGDSAHDGGAPGSTGARHAAPMANEGSEPDVLRGPAAEVLMPTVRHRVITVVDRGEDLSAWPLFKIWGLVCNEAFTRPELLDAQMLKKEVGKPGFKSPLYHPSLMLESTGRKLDPIVAWPHEKVAIFHSGQLDQFAIARESGWHVFYLGQGEFLLGIKTYIAGRDARGRSI